MAWPGAARGGVPEPALWGCWGLARPRGGPALSTRLSPRSPPRPSPGSLHYSDEDVTKYNDLIPAESSSLTEKPSEVSDSQVPPSPGLRAWTGWGNGGGGAGGRRGTLLGALTPLSARHHAGPGVRLASALPVPCPILHLRGASPWPRGTAPAGSWHSPRPLGTTGDGTGPPLLPEGSGLGDCPACPVAGGNGVGSASPTKWHLCVLPEQRAALAGQEPAPGEATEHRPSGPDAGKQLKSGG